VLVVFIAAVDAAFKDCGSKEGKIKDVLISGCKPTDNPCIIHKGTNTSLTIDFTTTSPGSITGVKTVVHGIIKGIPVPWPGVHTDACTQSGLVCPLKPSTSYAFTTSLLVSTSYPSIKALVKWELEDDKTGTDIICAIFPVELQ